MKGVNGIIMITKSINKINETTFYLSGKTMSYIMAVDKIGYLRHIYHGSKIRPRGGSEIRNLDAAWTAYVEDRIILETALFEYPAYGHADLRIPSYSVTNSGGDSVSELKFKGFEIKENHVPELNGLPCVFAGGKTAQTLEITLADEKSGLEAVLLYTVFEEYDADKALDIAAEKLHPRIWLEAYPEYWLKHCIIENDRPIWNDLIQMRWNSDLQIWESRDGTSVTIMLPPTAELIEREREKYGNQENMRKKK